jgi:hypothetical protein
MKPAVKIQNLNAAISYVFIFKISKNKTSKKCKVQKLLQMMVSLTEVQVIFFDAGINSCVRMQQNGIDKKIATGWQLFLAIIPISPVSPFYVFLLLS